MSATQSITWEKKYIKQLLKEKHEEFEEASKNANEQKDQEIKAKLFYEFYNVTDVEYTYLNLLNEGFIIADFWQREVINNYHKKEISFIYEYWYDDSVIGSCKKIINKKIQWHIERIK